MISTHGLLTINESGVQTESSLIEALKMLVKELKERKVQFPVVLLSDSHASRKGEKVLAFARKNGIRFFFEPSNTSGWLQALDQFNKKFHERYKKAKQRYKKTRQLEAHNPNLDEEQAHRARAIEDTQTAAGRNGQRGAPGSRR